jgi:stress-induced morphogen
MFRSTLSLSSRVFPLTSASVSPLVTVARAFSLTRPTLLAGEPINPHSESELVIRNKLVDRLEADIAEVQDTSGRLYPIPFLLSSLSSDRPTNQSNSRLSPGGCGTFYQIKVVSPAFIGLSKLKQHRLVNQVLEEEIKGIHGLNVNAPLPSLYDRQARC